MIFLTARDALTDRLAGFSAGGDDYLTKPFAFAELVARLRALLRRARRRLAVEAGALASTRRACRVSGPRRVALTPTEFRLLARLAAAPGRGRAPARAHRAAWPHGALVRDNTLDAYVARLRRKLASLAERADDRDRPRRRLLAR